MGLQLLVPLVLLVLLVLLVWLAHRLEAHSPARHATGVTQQCQ